MKRFLVFFFLLVASVASVASADYQPIQILTSSGIKPVGTVATMAESLPVDARITSFTISIPGMPPYTLPSTGVATNAYLDSSRNLMMNVASFTAPIPSGTNSIGTVRPPVLLAPYGSSTAALGGFSFVTPADGYHVSLSVQTSGADCWYVVGTTTAVVGGNRHHPLTFWADFPVPPNTPVAVICSTTASVTHQIDRR